MKATSILLLQVSQAVENSNSNSSTAENMIQLAGCVVTPTHNVNCSAGVYEDLPTWRTSKNNIDGAIRKLLAQVEALKVSRITIICCIRNQMLVCSNHNRPDLVGSDWGLTKLLCGDWAMRAGTAGE
jgi:hypothetical protein